MTEPWVRIGFVDGESCYNLGFFLWRIEKGEILSMENHKAHQFMCSTN